MLGDTAVLSTITIAPRPGEFPNAPEPGQSFGNKVRLLGYKYEENKRTAVAGNTLSLTLYWELLVPPEEISDIISEVTLYNAESDSKIRSINSLVRRVEPGSNLIIDTHEFAITAENSPGVYDATLYLFDIFTEKRVILVADKGYEVDNHLPLASIVVR